MAEIFGIEKLLSFIPKKKFGKFCKFGTSQLGFSRFGDEDIVFISNEYGVLYFGLDIFGDMIPFSGIYRTDNVSGYTRYYREPYYITKNPRYEDQQAWRGTFADAISAWQDLTPEQQEVYNKRAKNKNFTGYNLCIKETIEVI